MFLLGDPVLHVFPKRKEEMWKAHGQALRRWLQDACGMVGDHFKVREIRTGLMPWCLRRHFHPISMSHRSGRNRPSHSVIADCVTLNLQLLLSYGVWNKVVLVVSISKKLIKLPNCALVAAYTIKIIINTSRNRPEQTL